MSARTIGVTEAAGGKHVAPVQGTNVLCVGRYVVADRIAAGGMATVHIGRLQGAAGFSRTVAIKRLLPHFASDPEFEDRFIHEARLVARIQHPNVVTTLDAVADNGELVLVMDYVAGETLARLMQTSVLENGYIPHPIVLRVVRDALAGLHAAHEARDRFGNPLDIVHRDISPHNLIVGIDGVTRVLDFGIAKAATSVDTTREGVVRGKAAYMAPEQLLGARVSRRTDIYSMGVVLWEGLAGERLFPGACRPELLRKVEGEVPPPSQSGVTVAPLLERIVMKALAQDPSARFQTAQEMLSALERDVELATAEEVARWVRDTAAEGLAARQAVVSRVESSHCSLPPPAPLAAAAMVVTGQFEDTGSLAQPPTKLREGVTVTALQSWRRLAWGASAVIAGLLAALVWPFGVAPAPGEATTSAAASAASGVESTAVQAVATATPGAGAGTPSQSPKHPQPTASDSLPVSSSDTIDQEPVLKPSRQVSKPTAPSVAARARRTRGGSVPAPTQRRSRRNKCSPPYTVDSAGRRHYKAECF